MFVFIIIIPLLLWLLSIRPYCRRNGKGFTPGAGMGVTFWVDWQEAGEIAKAKGHRGMILACRFVFWLQVIAFIILVRALFR